MSLHVFISYKHESVDLAKTIYNMLQEWGYKVWFDLVDIPPSTYWPDEINKGLTSSEVIVGIVTPNAIVSHYVRDEWHFAIENSKHLLLLELVEVDVPYPFKSIQRIDFKKDYEQGIEKLRQTLQYLSTQKPNVVLLPPPPPVESSNDSYRRLLLQKVKTYWVDGILKKSLHSGEISRTKATKPDSVLTHKIYGSYTLPDDKPIIDVFDDMNHQLLILGEAGVGKTTLMLQLASELIARASSDPKALIPVVFNLSSWVEERKSIDKWMISELEKIYRIPQRVVRTWIENKKIIPLLDGLDEVTEQYRDLCVDALNKFQIDQGTADVVVCSRIDAFEKLSLKLNLEGAILLQPLNEAQIAEYLSQEHLSALRAAILEKGGNEDFQQMAETPFLLNIMALTYSNAKPNALKGLSDSTSARNYLFDKYIDTSFNLQPNPTFTLIQTRRYLTWLAKIWEKFPQSVFYIDAIQPYWLNSNLHLELYHLMVRLAFGVPAGLLLGILFSLIASIPSGILIGFSAALLPIEIVADRRRIGLYTEITWSTKQSLWGFFVGILLSSVISLIATLVWGKDVGIEVALVTIPIIAGLSGAVFGYVFGQAKAEQATVIAKPYQAIQHIIRNSFIFGVVSSILGLLLGFILLFSANLKLQIVLDVIILLSLIIFLAIALTILQISGFQPGPRTTSRLGWVFIRVSQFFLFPILSFLMLIGINLIPHDRLISILPIGAIVGFVIGAGMTILPVIQHYVLYLILCFRQDIDWNYQKFLDFAVECNILRKVGGGYVFIHRYLREYFSGKP